jgi:ATP-dependent Clp protease ATP-binding subunit ClpB
MTSNLASELWFRRRLGFGEGDKEEIFVTEEAVTDVLRRKLPNEFLSRVDEVVIFHPLSSKSITQIAKKKLTTIVQDRFSRQQIDVSFAPQVVDYVVSMGYDSRLGCRRLERVIQKEILEPMAKQMYQPDWQSVSAIRVTLTDGQVAFEAILED